MIYLALFFHFSRDFEHILSLLSTQEEKADAMVCAVALPLSLFQSHNPLIFEW